MIKPDKIHIMKKTSLPCVMHCPILQFSCITTYTKDTAWYLYMAQYGHTLDIPYFVKKI
nr:MAG TPA: hypothetical protein [Caudoviricetes sp.]